MEDVERASERLDNIQSVKPILGGLRTISLGSWQAALKQRSTVRDYAQRLQAMLPWLVPELKTRESLATRVQQRLPLPQVLFGGRESGMGQVLAPKHVIALAIGSERGLCGRFNIAVVEETERYLEEQESSGVSIRLMVLGSRAERVLRRRNHDPTSAGMLAMTSLPSLSLAFELTGRWLTAYEEHELDGVDLIHNQYRSTGTYSPTVTRLLPPQLATPEATPPEMGEQAESQDQTPTGSETSMASWPPPIIDTDPLSLYATVTEQSVAVHLYSMLLDSAAAEHSTRFQLMESATQNADRLIEELTLAIQTARRHAITQEMAELAVGAGLLDEE